MSPLLSFRLTFTLMCDQGFVSQHARSLQQLCVARCRLLSDSMLAEFLSALCRPGPNAPRLESLDLADLDCITDAALRPLLDTVKLLFCGNSERYVLICGLLFCGIFRRKWAHGSSVNSSSVGAVRNQLLVSNLSTFAAAQA